jgi:hypothetical protein
LAIRNWFDKFWRLCHWCGKIRIRKQSNWRCGCEHSDMNRASFATIRTNRNYVGLYLVWSGKVLLDNSQSIIAGTIVYDYQLAVAVMLFQVATDRTERLIQSGSFVIRWNYDGE